jgi:drug/metabolite transporter (DMT)-like permease
MTAYDYLLYGITVFAWSTSWSAIKFQIGIVAPEVSLVWRFLISAALMWAWAIVARLPLRYGLDLHLRFLVMGATLFSMNFLLMYYAGATLPSGLLSVVFALTAVVTPVLGIAFLGTRLTLPLGVGGLLGVLGVALMFWPQIAGSTFDMSALTGLGFALASVAFFSIGSVVSAGVQRRQVPVMAANAWGMTYGTIIVAALAILRGDTFIFDVSVGYIGSLLFLAIVSSGLAFWSYLTLIGRIGSERAGYAAVMYPVFALMISTVLEGYHWTIIAIVGLVFALGGNVLVMRRGQS